MGPAIKDSTTKILRWWGVLAAGYLVVGLFAIGYFLMARVYEEVGPEAHITAGILLAAPLAVAFLWDRLRTVKALGVEITLSDSTADLFPLVEPELENVIATTQYFSGKEAILKKVSDALQIPNRPLLEVNLHAEPYWWSTRLFLEAALLDDYSQVCCLIFVEGDEDRRYVGMTTPRLLREGLAVSTPYLERIYKNLLSKRLAIEKIIDCWSQEDFDGHGQREKDAKTLVDGKGLYSILGARLETTAVYKTEREGPLLHYKVLFRGDRFVPVVKDGRLERVVDADDFARRWSLASLENALR